MDFGIMLGQAYQGFVRELHAHLATFGYHLTGASYGYVLRALAESPLTASQLAGQLGITAQGAAKVVDEMVRHGYVERRPDPADKRAKTLHLSERGRDILGKVREFHADYERRLAARVGPEHIATVRAVLTEIITAATDPDADHAFRPL
ncbi:MarR family winged helix-turn-helix transcriptional regulator [Nocardia brasiliensis]|uniref:MarR family winged helix-turn-helix transcriptional regulator n=1 Tax=Nocardia brasiliensis TaxID=37326 RepID=UPI0002F577CC|nr:MarR family transcriptional regulator [Nocardia brasiliensis]ASF08237.1 MarR family transcriptional regulator [Nocardia brasiliensis]SUB41319.1 transcriptional repressor MprA [Nocardia brasiliensis]